MAEPVAFVLKGYPRLSETFIAEEIRALEALGLDIVIVALRRPTDRARHPVHAAIRAPVLYLPEYLWHAPLRVLAAWRACRRRPGYAAARRAWLRDLRRDPSPNRVRRFGQALVAAVLLDGRVTRLHAHFLHTPASVARYAAQVLGVPWSLSAHAKDIWTTPDWEIAEKLADCAWAVTCTAAGRDHLARRAPPTKPVHLVHHGIDLKRFAPPSVPPSLRNGSDPDDPVIVLSVGRAVAKKGYDDLLAALAALPPDLAWRFVHIGDGPLAAPLRAHAERLGLAARIDWRGAQSQDAVLAAYREADIFVLANRIAADGDRDGLPNVVVEALSQDRACVLARMPGTAELVEDGVSAMLAPPGEPAAFAAAIAALARDPARRRRLGGAGAARVRRHFALAANIERLAPLFGLAEAETRSCASPSMRR